MRLFPWLAPVAVALALAHCGGAVDNPSLSSPGAPGSDAGAGGVVVGNCGAGGSCPTGSTCYFPIGSCDAVGECVTNPAPGTPECGAEELLCGCGQQAVSGCGFPSGFASAPATGSGDCEVSNPVDAGPALDAAPVPDATAPQGPCSSDSDCNPGYGCYYLIGACPSQGECVAQPGGPGCGAEEGLCGCDGSQVASGCGFPSGYASGPSDGAPFCETIDAGLPDSSVPDAALDAGSNCASLAACCTGLSTSEQTSCEEIVSYGDDDTCGSELASLEAAGYCQ